MFKTNLFCHLCALVLTIYAQEEVLVLEDGDFDAKLKEIDAALIMFYVPQCSHCIHLKPEFAKAARDLIKNDPSVVLAKVDCTSAGKRTCKKYTVSGYPLLTIFRNGDMMQDYNGPRQAADIVEYMKAQVKSNSKELKSVDDFDEFVKTDGEASVVGFFEKETALKKAFIKLADKLREKVRFAHTSSKEILNKQGVNNAIFLFRPLHLANKFEDNTVRYFGSPLVEDINAFVTKNFHGLVGHRKLDNVQEFQNPLIVVYYAVDYVKNVKGTNYWRNRILQIAKEFKNYNFAISNTDEFQHELDEHGVDLVEKDKPVVFATDVNNKLFILQDEFSIKSVKQFVTDLTDGKLEPYFKSEPIPKTNDKVVKVAVARNFDDVVVNNNKDTLVEFYAPWSDDCKKLDPTYKRLAKTLVNEDVAIVKMNAIANDVPLPYDVLGFPTLYWVPKDNKKAPTVYKGGLELSDFIKYIAKHATNELNGYDRKGKEKKIEL